MSRVPLSRGAAVGVLLGVVFNLGLLVLAHLPEQKTLAGDEQYYFELAEDRAGGEDRAGDPFWPPLYGALLNGLFRLFGPRVLPVQFLQIALWLAVCAIWYRVSIAVVADRRAAVATAGLLLFGADFAPFAHYLWPEVLHAALVSAAIGLLVLCRPSSGNRGAGADLLAGLLLGLALLTKLLLLPLLPVLVAVAAYAGGGPRWRSAGALALGIALPLAPVMAANVHAGQPALASSGVFNLWLGLNDPPLGRGVAEVGFREAQRYRASAPTVTERNAVYRRKIANKVRSEGALSIAAEQLDKQYVRLLDRDTFFVQQLPGGARSAYRFDAPALNALLRAYAYATHALLLAAAAFGLAFLPGRPPGGRGEPPMPPAGGSDLPAGRGPLGWPHMFAGFLLYNLALFFLLHVNPRFLVQLVPFLAFFAGIGVARGADAARSTGPAHPRLLAGMALASLVLYLTFLTALPG